MTLFSKVSTAPALKSYYQAKLLTAVEGSDLDEILRATVAMLREARSKNGISGLYDWVELRYAMVQWFGLGMRDLPEDVLQAACVIGDTRGVLELVDGSLVSIATETKRPAENVQHGRTFVRLR